jgi:hypothetical protein
MKSHSRRSNSIVHLYSGDLLSLKRAMFLHVRLRVILLHLAKFQFFRRSLCWPVLQNSLSLVTRVLQIPFHITFIAFLHSCVRDKTYTCPLSTIQHAIYKFYFLDPKSIPLAPLIMFCTTFRYSNTVSVMIRIRVG